jgi:hypothetical protein
MPDKLTMQILNLFFFSQLNHIESFERIMPFDPKKYLRHFEDHDLTESEKIEWIHAVKKIFEDRIDSAFGLHPVQQCLKHTPKKDLQSPKGNVESKPSTCFSNNATEHTTELHLHNER